MVSPTKAYQWPTSIREMLDTISHLGSAHQHHRKLLHHTSGVTEVKDVESNRWDAGRCWRKRSMVRLLWRPSDSSSEHWTDGRPLIQQVHSGTNPNELKIVVQINTRPGMFIAALFTMAKRRKGPVCPLTTEWTKEMWFFHTMARCSAGKGRCRRAPPFGWKH